MGNKNTILSNEDSALVVRSSRDEKPVHYTLKIQSFSWLKTAVSKSRSLHNRYESQIFNAAGYKWKLALYPNGDVKKNGSNHISLYLVTAEDDILSATSEVNVVFTFLVYDTLRDKYLAVRDGKMRRFHAMKTECGFEKLIPLETFNNASNGFLVDDCCVFGVDIFVIKCNVDIAAKGEVLSLIRQPSRYNYYIREFKNFSQLQLSHYESCPFAVEDHNWKVRIYPNGDSREATGFLSLYLILDSLKKGLPQGFQVYVEYEVAVLSGVESEKIKDKCWFNGNSGRGWQKVMALTDLKEPTKGFLCNDTLTVEVKINFISTLKKF